MKPLENASDDVIRAKSQIKSSNSLQPFCDGDCKFALAPFGIAFTRPQSFVRPSLSCKNDIAYQNPIRTIISHPKGFDGVQ